MSESLFNWIVRRMGNGHRVAGLGPSTPRNSSLYAYGGGLFPERPEKLVGEGHASSAFCAA